MSALPVRIVALLLLAVSAFAADDTVQDKNIGTIRARLTAAMPGVQITAVTPAPIPGMYQVVLDGSETAFVSADGQYLITGDLIQATPKGLVNVSEQSKGGLRRDTLARADRKDMITFPAKGKEKARIYVFTDVDCAYCRKFHQQIADINAGGVTVHYLAFPRSGLSGDTYNKMQGVWCAADRNKALSDAKRGGLTPVAPVACKSPVADEYRMGVAMGVRGTPAVFTVDGEQIGGYIPTPELLKQLGVK